jgi:CubicO group peptidase (beta-lactamase class C family)
MTKGVLLRRAQLQFEPGARAEYSNVGVALLGHALSLRAGVSFEDLLRRRLFEPLVMMSTAITLTAEERARQATGHNPKRVPVPPWTGGIMAPTGEAKSTASDMLKFAAAVLDSNAH